MPDPIGIIAGAGSQPAELIRHIQTQGKNVTTVGFTGLTDPDLETQAACFEILPFGQIDRLVAFLTAHGAKTLCFAGEFALPPAKDIRPDARAMKLFFRLQGAGKNAFMNAIGQELEQEGFCVRPLEALFPDFAEAALADQSARA